MSDTNTTPADGSTEGTNTDTTEGTTDESRRTTFAFVCVRNAGRSQMATAFAERERAARGLEKTVEILTGGIAPADEVHQVVVEALAEVDLDVNGRTPQSISDEVLAECDVVATMGCSTLALPDRVEAVDWALEDPGERPIEEVREIRDEVERRVIALFDERFGTREEAGARKGEAAVGAEADEPGAK
ncbi:arsenate-mycothiol transferase ArsC [Halorubrum gandharaense]